MLLEVWMISMKSIRQLAIISRSEFLLPNLGSLIMGLAWGANPPLDLSELVFLMALSFTIINLSSAIGAQANTISDYELDSRDSRKKELVQAIDSFGHHKLKKVLVTEFVITFVLVAIFTSVRANPILLLMWILGISLGVSYSVPPLRIKSKSWLAPVTLILVLGIFPVIFAYFSFTSKITPVFLVALLGLALTVYGVIVSTEIRDYFGDKAMGIETMTVRLGLVQASLFSMILLSIGGILIGIAFLIAFIQGKYPPLTLLLIAIVVADLIVLKKLRKLHLLSIDYESSTRARQNQIEKEIIDYSANNPKWIMLVTQTYSILSIIMLTSKFMN
jgi:4-hydroxybenzoate polyprenyltransferase